MTFYQFIENLIVGLSFGGLGVPEKKPIFYDQILWYFFDFTSIYLWRRNLNHHSFGFFFNGGTEIRISGQILSDESDRFSMYGVVYPPKNQNMIPQNSHIY